MFMNIYAEQTACEYKSITMNINLAVSIIPVSVFNRSLNVKIRIA